ncbi:MAG TPA: cytochrome c biogenesis protein CcdA, partial [Isosphaeraceae bacterium]|nr:cytochrome c biogenesis protein CcdA [Isosphaeraceae bacterium]
MPALKHRWILSISMTALVALAASTASAQQPKHKDTRDFLKPKEVTYKTSVVPAQAKPGDRVTYSVEVSVKAPWHIYAYAAEQPPQGPRNTQFDLFDPAGLKSDGKWTPDRKPVRKKEPAFPDLDAVEFYENTVTWSTTLTIPQNATPGKKSISAQIYYQICNESTCKPPSYVTLPPATVSVVAGSAMRTTPRDLAAALLIGITETPATEESPTAEASAPPPANETQAKIESGLVPFLLFAALNGLLAVLMPCVWPMIPITVNFFVKQSHAKGGNTVGLALVYCLAITGLYTLIGIICSFFGPQAANVLGNNPWVNLLFGAVFVAFGLSLLGLFEIRLPSALLNASAKGESRGGLIGVMFMASTLTITSFTCTAPLVGSLLAMAVQGKYFYPIVGLLTFSLVLSLPFVVLAMAPSLLSKMPKSGDWMNTVKVIGGLLEIGAAFKFLNVAEMNFRGANRIDDIIIDAHLTLAIWVVLALVCGIYLLGLFRTDHDHDVVKVGAGRMLTGVLFLSLALYLAPALFGNPPKNGLYAMLSPLLPPGAAVALDSNEQIVRQIRSDVQTALLDSSGRPSADSASEPKVASGPRSSNFQGPVEATSTDPAKAVREERTFHGVSWGL